MTRHVDSDPIRITLTVKNGPGARSEALRRLNEWFVTDAGEDAPYRPGALLHYSVHDTTEATPAEPRAWLEADGIPWEDSEGATEWPAIEAEALADMLRTRMRYDVTVHPA